MVKLDNCAQCGAVFAKGIREICQKCYRDEEDAFQKVYRFLTKRKNREANLNEIVEATGVAEELIIKFMKQKRLRASTFRNLAYPCEKCGSDIVEGHICTACSIQMKTELEQFNEIEEREEKRKERVGQESIYYTINKEK